MTTDHGPRHRADGADEHEDERDDDGADDGCCDVGGNGDEMVALKVLKTTLMMMKTTLFARI